MFKLRYFIGCALVAALFFAALLSWRGTQPAAKTTAQHAGIIAVPEQPAGPGAVSTAGNDPGLAAASTTPAPTAAPTPNSQLNAQNNAADYLDPTGSGLTLAQSRRMQANTVSSRLGNPAALAIRDRTQPDGTIRRSRLVKIDGKYPHVVIEGNLPAGQAAVNADDSANDLRNQIARVANHILVNPTANTSEAEFLQAITQAGLNPVRRISPDGPFLVATPEISITAAEEAIQDLSTSPAVDFAEPDYMVFTSELSGFDVLVEENGELVSPDYHLSEELMPMPEGPVLDPGVIQTQAEELAATLPVGTRILTYDAPQFIEGPGSYKPYMEHAGFITSTDGGAYIQIPYNSGYPNNGSCYARSLSSETSFTIRHREGLPFTILQLDLAEYSYLYATPRTVGFTGYKADGSTVFQQFTTDGIMDGTGPAQDFQTFIFNSTFTNLTHIVANTTRYMVDNIAVIVEGQETPPPAPPPAPLIYDITFDSPIHKLDQLVSVSGPFAPSNINFGTPTVVAALGSMPGPLVRLQGSSTYQQFEVVAKRMAKKYRLECDLYIDFQDGGELVIFADAGLNRIEFRSNGTMNYSTGSGSAVTYPMRQTFSLTVDVDTTSYTIDIYLDGVKKSSGPFNASSPELNGFRFHSTNSGTSAVGIDNIRVSAFDPTELNPLGPRLKFSSSGGLSFVNVPVNSSKTWTLGVNNTGAQNLVVTDIWCDNPLFTFTGANLPQSVLPGGNIVLNVTFRPTQSGAFTGKLYVASNDPLVPVAELPLSGNAIGTPRVALNPAQLDVTMLEGQTGTETFTISNSGDEPAHWNLVLKGGTGPGGSTGSAVTPNDPLYSSLWGMKTPSSYVGGIDATRAWSATTGSPDLIIGVIDTGVDRSHPDLAANMWENTAEIPGNGVDDDLNGYVDDRYGWDFFYDDNNPSDIHGHGTHVSGTIAARGDNALGVTGVCWTAQVMALKFLSDYGTGYTSDAVAAVTYARQMGARLTNNSWGGGGYSQSLYNAISAAGNAGQLFLAAAGNSATDNDVSGHYPSSYDLDCVVSVASTDQVDGLSYFSCYGRTSVDLAAPGSSIRSLLPGAKYGTASGTSMATPHVTGVAGLLLAQNPGLNVSSVKSQLLFGTQPIPALADKVVTEGRLNANRSLRTTLPDWLKPLITSGTVEAGESMEVPLSVNTADLPPGNYTQVIALSSNDPLNPIIDLPVNLNVIPADSYNSWLTSSFSQANMLHNASSLTVWDDLADPDEDGMANVLEYITSSDPKQGGAVPYSMVNSGDGQVFCFNVRDDISGASFHPEWTTDLASGVWYTEGLVELENTTEGMPTGVRRVEVKLQDPPGDSVFFRLAGSRAD